MPNNNNPWLGLKTYSEGQVLYGRSEEISALSQDILFNRQTVVYGKSGIGKSSLLNAGVFPILRRSNMFPVNVRLDHKSKKISYCEQIWKCIEDSLQDLRRDVVGTDGKKQTLEKLKGVKKELCQPVPNKEGESLWEYFHRHVFFDDKGEEIQPVIVFDQFEEIFTLCKEEETRKLFFDQLADLINDVPPFYIYNENEKSVDDLNLDTDEVIDGSEDFVLIEDEEEDGNQTYNYLQEPKFHIVITLREDFLSYLERYTTNIPLLKHNRYCLRPLSDDQAGSIITDPVPGLISEEVAVEIICKITDSNPDEFKLGDGIAQLEVDSAILSLFLSELYKKKAPEDKMISIDLVRAIGDNIINSFYEETIAGISEKSAEYLERRLVTEDERRDSIFEDRALSRGVTKEELKYLKDERLIHEFPWNDDGMRIEFMHDILCPVIAERRKKRELRKIKEEEDRKKEEETQKRIQAEEQKRLEVERKAEEEKRRLKEEAIRIRRKNKRRLYAIAIGMVVVGIIGFGVYWAKFKSYSVYYGNYTIVNGWPEGVGDKLTDMEVRQKLIVHYKLTRTGWLPQEWGGRPFHKVEVVDADKKLNTNKFYEVPVVGLLETELDDVKAKAFSDMQRKTAYWEFAPGGSGFNEEAARCIAYSKDKKELYSIQYYKDNTYVSQDSSKYVQWAVFNDANGKQMMVTDNGIDRMRQTIKNGVVTGCLFFTELGTPQKNAYGVYGYQYEVNDNNLIKRQCSVDKFGAVIDSTAIDYLEYDYGRIRKTSLYEVSYPQKRMIVYRFRDFNDTLTFNNNGTLGSGSFHTFGAKYSKIAFMYDENGHPLKSERFDENKLVTARYYNYLNKTGKLDSISIYQDGEKYMEKYVYPSDSTTIIEFWKNNKRHAMWRTNEFGDSLYYHRSIESLSTDSFYNIYTTEYKDDLGNPISRDYGKYSNKLICYAMYSKSKDKNTNNIILEYFYDSYGEICKSEWFEYDEYGNRIARAVAGIDGTPVRCPYWDWNNNCYFKMKSLKIFNGDVYAGMCGCNEFGEESYVIQNYNGNQYYVTYSESPLLPIEVLDSINATKVPLKSTYGMSLSYLNRTKIAPDAKEAQYIHLQSKHGEMFKAQIKNQEVGIMPRILDGDIIYSIGEWTMFNSSKALEKEWKKIEQEGGEIDILRVKDNSYIKLVFNISKGNLGAEFHSMPLTIQERNRIGQLK